MKNSFKNPRRIVTGIFLGMACLMLIAGLTFFSSRLQGAQFLEYWLICFLLTGIAAILALVEMTIVRRKSREEQRELIASTLADAEKEARESRRRKNEE